MAVTKEVIAEIAGFSLGKKNPDQIRRSEDFGEIEPGCKLVYGVHRFQQRAIKMPGQPKVLGWTSQPALGLEIAGNVIPLAYEADVVELGEDRIAKIADRLNAVKVG